MIYYMILSIRSQAFCNYCITFNKQLFSYQKTIKTQKYNFKLLSPSPMITCIGLDSSFEKAINITNGNLEVFSPYLMVKLSLLSFFFLHYYSTCISRYCVNCLFVCLFVSPEKINCRKNVVDFQVINIELWNFKTKES